MCGRSGPFADTIDGSWAAWDADHEAVAKAREALAFTIGVLDNVIMYRTTNDAHNAKMAEVRAALALLGEDHKAEVVKEALDA